MERWEKRSVTDARDERGVTGGGKGGAKGVREEIGD